MKNDPKTGKFFTGNYNDITGQKFHMLTAISYVDSKTITRGARWLFKCDCGKEKVMPAANIIAGGTKTCGCSRIPHVTKHGFHKTRLYRSFYGMHQRCENPKNTMYHLYGARGIKVCNEWNTFDAFREWSLKNGYEESLSIDRIDSNGNYEPSNCKWSTTAEQARNRRTSIMIEWEGIVETMNYWSKKLGIDHATLHYRYHKKGLRPPELFRKPR